MKSFKRAMASAVALLLSVSAHAALVSTAGGLGVYDTVNNVTWTSDGNLFATQAGSYAGGASAFVAAVIAASGGVVHDTPNSNDTVAFSGNHTLSGGDFITYGFVTLSWWGAKAWVNYLNATNYAGTNTWALPTTVDNESNVGYPDGWAGRPSQSSSQLAQLFYGGLGQVAGTAHYFTHNSSYALFSNLQSVSYWAGTESSTRPQIAWGMYVDGKQDRYYKDAGLYAMAVAPGQVGALSAVPVPGAVWLLGSGVMGLVGLRRRKATAQSAA